MSIVLAIIVFVFILGLIILVHEGGHFFFAKKAGILCHEFSLGMGPVLWQTKKGETYYSVRAIPIGGFVSMAGEEVEMDPLKDKKEVRLDIKDDKIVQIILDTELKEYADLPKVKIIQYDIYGTKEALPDELYIRYTDENGEEVRTTVVRDAMVVFSQKQRLQIAPYDRNFNNKPLWARFKSIVAGPLMNFALAIVLFIIVSAVVGTPNYDDTVIDKTIEHTPVYGQLQDYDRIISIDGVKVNKWEDISTILRPLSKNYKENITIMVEGKTEPIVVHPQIFFYSAGFVSDYKVQDRLIVGNLVVKGHAEKAGMKIGDEIVKLNGEVVTTWQQVIYYFNDHVEGQSLTMELKRGSETVTINIEETWNKGVLDAQDLKPVEVKIGINPKYTFNLSKWIPDALSRTGSSFLLIFNSIGLLATNEQVGLSDLSGPVGILNLIYQMLDQGFISLVNFAGILSVNVGFINLLPLPALDGGRLAFLGYEAITRKKPSAKAENFIHMIGFILLMALFVIVTFNDVLNIFK